MGKKWLLLCILIDIAAVGLIPLNSLYLHMPEFVTIFAAIIALVAAVIFIIKSRSRKVAKAIVAVLAVLASTVAILGSYCNPYWNSINFRSHVDYNSRAYDFRLSSNEAMEDLNYAMKYLKKLHPALYNGTPEDINQQYEIIKNRIEEYNDLSVNDLAREIQSVFSILKDGHTYVCGNYEEKILKYYNKWVNEGYEITAVNGIKIDDLLEQKSSLYSFEVPSWERRLLLKSIVTEDGIDYLGFNIANGIEYTLTSKDGTVRNENCYLDDFIPWYEYVELYDSENTDTTEESFVRYEIDEENSIVILHLDECEYNSEYINTVRKMFEKVKDKNIKNVAVDLRFNGGGNSQVVNEFLKYFDIDSYKTGSMGWRLGFLYLNMGNGIYSNEKYEDLLFKGNLYLLTSTSTFSSAMMFAQYVKDNNIGTIIGEAPGNNPNGYGEVSCFMLPNSRLYMQISTKRFYRADSKSTDELVYPDIECDSKNSMEELYRVITE
ncbi:MAG: hypothetical protein GX187_07945 [Clostridiaceae bacterium]|nr:hypothetical protein [Clostridiaceae bacterium]